MRQTLIGFGYVESEHCMNQERKCFVQESQALATQSHACITHNNKVQI